MKLILFFLLTLSLYAKTSDYSIILKKPFDAALFDITQDYDRDITAVGFSKEYKTSSSSSKTYTNAFDYLSSVSASNGSQMHLIKADASAKIILNKVFTLSNFNKAVAVVKTPTNGYFVGGYTLSGSLLVLKLDASANILFSKEFGTKNYDRMSNLILLSDGGVLAIGSSVTSRSPHDNIFNTGLGNNDIFLTRFSKDGQMLWSKKYGTEHDDNGIDAVEAIDGSIIVISTTSYNVNRDVSLMRINENGNRIWLKHYQEIKNHDNTIIPKKIIRLKDNNFLVVLTQYNQMQKEHIRLIKFDLYQNILLDKEIFTTYPSEINDIKEYSNGKLIAVGYVKDIYNTDGLAMILDSSLQLLNQEHYGDENYDVFNAVTILNNSQAAVAGVHTDNSSQEMNMWITKLNSDASISQVSLSTESIYEMLLVLFKKEIQAKQIKILQDLSINIIDKNLYFGIEEYNLSKKQKLFFDTFSLKLISFLYLHREKIESLSINGHTSSEWGKANFENSYLKNVKLSLNRAYSTMSYIFQKQNRKLQVWLIQVLQGTGDAYAKNIKFNDIEDKKLSRRVSFKIVLK